MTEKQVTTVTVRLSLSHHPAILRQMAYGGNRHGAPLSLRVAEVNHSTPQWFPGYQIRKNLEVWQKS